MKIVQTFWSGSSSRAKLSDMTGGWLSAEYHWMSWALSCLQAARFFKRVELVTDNRGKEILIDRLELPYTGISTALEGILDEAPPELFSLAKLFTYRQQTEPFLHIDGDVFLFQRPSQQWLASPLLAQNIDWNLLFYEQTLDKINECFSFVPACMRKEHYQSGDIEAANAGVFGGSDLSFIQEYCAAGFEFVSRNRQDIGRFPPANLNFIFEQYLLFCLAKEKTAEISYLIPEAVESLWYQQFVRFQDLPHIIMAHPVGGFKKSTLICNHVARKLRREYPLFYYKILRLVKESGGDLYSRVYAQGAFIDLAEKIQAGSAVTAGDTDYMQYKAKHQAVTSGLPETYFQRTEAAIRYFTECGWLPARPDEQKALREGEVPLLPDVLTMLADETAKEMLGEIYLVDAERKDVFAEYFMQPDSIMALYKKDVRNYDRSQQVFAMSEGHSDAIEISLNSDVRVVDLRWELPFETAPAFRELLANSRQQEEAFHQLVLIPDVFRLQVEEYYLDNLDSIVVSCCRQPASIAAIIKAVSEYFDAEEIAANEQAFESMLLSVLKRLCYANVLHIE